jgi:asparagine synthase (glutamine-hydrolysing)
MCGISGLLSRDRGYTTAIGRMVDVMRHRGPDADGTFSDDHPAGGGVALGHNRLSIIDLSNRAAQPMTSRDGRFVLVYNGEIYNYREIAAELDPADRPDSGAGDTEVILAALAAWGTDALAKFNGMWALLLYDRHARTLMAARDRFGIKPLYVFDDGRTWHFASEIKAILAASSSRFRLDPATVVPYLTRGLLNFSDRTFFDGIRQFPPASYQVVSLGDTIVPGPVERYWSHPIERPDADGRALSVSPTEVRDLFIESVKLRLRSDVPVGLLLSGGIDSSAILGAIAHAGATENLTVLSVTSDDAWANEEPYIDRMAQYAGVASAHLQKINVSQDPVGLHARLGDACWFNDEPVCGIADIAELRLMERSRQLGIKVLLSGQGADEQLGGYNKFFYFYLTGLVRQGRVGRAAATLCQSALRSRTLYEFRISEAIRYLGARGNDERTFVHPGMRHHDNVDIGFAGSYERREWIDLVKTSVPALLHYEDRMSMSQSVEVRVPFLDYRLVECLARVSPDDKFEGGWSKSIFRKAIEGLVPPEIQYRRDKKGFTVPEDVWMRRELRPQVEAVMASGLSGASEGFVDPDRFKTLFGRFLDGRGVLNGRHFYRAIAFEAFVDRFAPWLTLSGRST